MIATSSSSVPSVAAVDAPNESKKRKAIEALGEETASEGGMVQLPDALRPSNALHAEDGSGQHEAGIILRVRVENFMCHRLFDISLGQKVNFITGQNGSGQHWVYIKTE